MRPADSKLLEGEFCDPACDLEDCINKLLPETWKVVKGCNGSETVGLFVNQTRPSTRVVKIRGCKSQPVSATLNVRIETDTCNTRDCAAGAIEQCLRALLEGRSNCCCADLIWIDTDRSIDSKNNREIRLMRFAAELLTTREK